MDEDTLAPMADALSATLAVIVLLICFFILAQLNAVSKQIKLQNVGDAIYMKKELVIDFDEPEISEGKLKFFKSFDAKKDKETIEKYITQVKESCTTCEKFLLKSNYPLANVSKERSTRRALSNAIKILPFLYKNGMDYEIEITNSHNHFFIEIVGEK